LAEFLAEPFVPATDLRSYTKVVPASHGKNAPFSSGVNSVNPIVFTERIPHLQGDAGGGHPGSL
jgi:hypothetical protein